METTFEFKPRRIHLSDAMILITVLAIGFAIAVRALSDSGEWFAMIKPSQRADVSFWWNSVTRKSEPQFLVCQGYAQIASCLIVRLIPALLVVRLAAHDRPCSASPVSLVSSLSAALCVAALISTDLAVTRVVSERPLVVAVLPGATVLTS
jgi:hypothetical protein